MQVAKLLTQNGLQRKVAFVTGDDVLSDLDSLNVQPLEETAEPFQKFQKLHGKILSAKVYIGSAGIQPALEQGADFVTVGRCTDGCYVVSILIELGDVQSL